MSSSLLDIQVSARRGEGRQNVVTSRRKDIENKTKQMQTYHTDNPHPDTISLKHGILSPDISLITDVTVQEECP